MTSPNGVQATYMSAFRGEYRLRQLACLLRTVLIPELPDFSVAGLFVAQCGLGRETQNSVLPRPLACSQLVLSFA